MSDQQAPSGGVVEAALRQVEGMFAAHRAEMRGLIDRLGELTLRDHFAGVALQVLEYERLSNDQLADEAYKLADAMLRRRGMSLALDDVAKIRAAVGVPGDSFTDPGIVGTSGLGWVPDEIPTTRRDAFFLRNAGKRIEVTYRTVDDTRDTERPPPPVPGVGEDLDELAPPPGRMVPRGVAGPPCETRLYTTPEQLAEDLGGADPNDDVEPAVGDALTPESFSAIAPAAAQELAKAKTGEVPYFGTIVDGPKVKA